MDTNKEKETETMTEDIQCQVVTPVEAEIVEEDKDINTVDQSSFNYNFNEMLEAITKSMNERNFKGAEVNLHQFIKNATSKEDISYAYYKLALCDYFGETKNISAALNHAFTSVYFSRTPNVMVYEFLGDLFAEIGNNEMANVWYDLFLSKYNNNTIDEMPKHRVRLKKANSYYNSGLLNDAVTQLTQVPSELAKGSEDVRSLVNKVQCFR